MTKPLEGIRVIDLTQYLAGPQATLFLAGMGAEVIRINNPHAQDPVADSSPYAGPKGVSFRKQTETTSGSPTSSDAFVPPSGSPGAR